MDAEVLKDIREKTYDRLIEDLKLFTQQWVKEKKCDCEFDDIHVPYCKHIKKARNKAFKARTNFLWNLTIYEIESSDKNIKLPKEIYDKLITKPDSKRFQ